MTTKGAQFTGGWKKCLQQLLTEERDEEFWDEGEEEGTHVAGAKQSFSSILLERLQKGKSSPRSPHNVTSSRKSLDIVPPSHSSRSSLDLCPRAASCANLGSHGSSCGSPVDTQSPRARPGAALVPTLQSSGPLLPRSPLPDPPVRGREKTESRSNTPRERFGENGSAFASPRAPRWGRQRAGEMPRTQRRGSQAMETIELAAESASLLIVRDDVGQEGPACLLRATRSQEDYSEGSGLPSSNDASPKFSPRQHRQQQEAGKTFGFAPISLAPQRSQQPGQDRMATPAPPLQPRPSHLRPTHCAGQDPLSAADLDADSMRAFVTAFASAPPQRPAAMGLPQRQLPPINLQGCTTDSSTPGSSSSRHCNTSCPSSLVPSLNLSNLRQEGKGDGVGSGRSSTPNIGGLWHSVPAASPIGGAPAKPSFQGLLSNSNVHVGTPRSEGMQDGLSVDRGQAQSFTSAATRPRGYFVGS